MRKRPKIYKVNIQERDDFAKAHVQWNAAWRNVVFSDEKKFNLDGPDGWTSYWHDTRMKDIEYSKRKIGGGGVKIWLAASYDYKSTIAFVEGDFNSKVYIKVLTQHLKPLLTSIGEAYEEEATFQQDNDPSHVSDATLSWIERQGITLLGWPAHSPDLSPMENIFGILAGYVYEGSKQYNTVNELRKGIEDAWARLDQTEIQQCIGSMPQRMIDVIAAKGKSTRY